MQHWMFCVLFLCFVFCDVSTQRKKKEKKTQTLSRGWGEDITWVQTYEEGLAKAHESNMPLMIIQHLEDCQYSKALKKAFVEHATIQRLAKSDFVMLNLVHETTDKNLSPDGFYVPRIMFVDPSLTVRADITGKYANRMYTYEAGDMDFLAENMMKAKILLKSDHGDHDDL
ncbi:anterior gradient 1 [Pseudorasbora parva]|uniref:anterior gradient 1 n=1 Tax=Pseudorasbora parva TaxID=51549 RepID=UPI00351EBB0D